MQTAQTSLAAGSRAPVLRAVRDRPLVAVAVFLMLGIWAAANLPVPIIVSFPAMMAVFLLAALLFARNADITLPVLAAAFLCGYVLLQASLPGWAADPWAPEGQAEVRGRIVRLGTTAGGYAQYTIDDVCVNEAPLNGLALVTVRSAAAGVREGDGIAATLALKRPEPSRYFSGFNARGYYLRRGIRFTGFAAALETTPSGTAPALPGLPARAREYAAAMLNRSLGPECAALVSALLSGDKSAIPEDVSDSFVNLGVAHLLAVSGLNITLTAGAAWLLLRKLRVPMPVSLAASFLVLVSYVLFAGFTPSVERAAVMWAVMMGGMVAARQYDPLSSVSAAAVIILALNPLDLFDAGFQLSFLATAAMFLWLAPLMRHVPEMRWMRAAASSVGVTVCVTLLALPVILGCFHGVSLLSPLANLVLVPASLMLQLAGTALLLTGFLPGISGVLGPLLDWAAGIYLDTVRTLDMAGASIAGATPPLWLAAVFAVLAAAVSPPLARLGRGTRITALAALAAVICVMLLPMPAAFTGHGRAAVIAEGSRSVSLYWQDGGGRFAACDGAVREMAGYLQTRGVAHLDALYVMRAKPPADGSQLLELDDVRVDTLYVPDGWLENPDADAFLGQARALGIKPRGAGVAWKNRNDMLRLALPGDLADEVANAYNITECGSIEVRENGGKAVPVPWRSGWENGLQGNFR